MRRKVFVVAGALIAVWLGLAIGVFLLPQAAEPVHADAVVVLSGDRSLRIERALELMRRGVAPTLVISGWPDQLYTRAASFCTGRARFRVICIWPQPYSTRGEARNVVALARANGWRSIVVVSSGYHLFRARLLFRRCWQGGLQMAAADYSGWRIPQILVDESAKLVLALTVRRGC